MYDRAFHEELIRMLSDILLAVSSSHHLTTCCSEPAELHLTSDLCLCVTNMHEPEQKSWPCPLLSISWVGASTVTLLCESDV